ncbi:phosphoribosylaminoimidazolesuccinocarboxamide synthase [Enterococcus quebecensis]|uniref:Phosphoribosylaminoimidazole-succinocarboxamide synthase n=1 Tax=Enterococcus quebecensis TaxID=903983 RepID=A0A1E5H2T9_9ENTE|nr:phosphoribosylaminoimidazolesuccinocarboxamide synthase [Enterococcus quebecensis]OEG19213.1 phosphoribosylaminoimidazolesuccinocarboxamide synthase [Enterococcus quebecensis]OJG75881.1 phosphoribosylaminoimidazolesuccinocarboxamide synthase [Enterococcus quebecensis]
MGKSNLLYEGKAKRLFETEDPQVLRVVYLDQATALNGVRKDMIQGKAELNNQITAIIFEYFNQKGLLNHFIKKISKDEQLVESLKIIPLEVVIRNVSAGSFSKRLSISEGQQLEFPILEFYYKDDHLDDPMINDDHVKFLKIATEEEIATIKHEAHKVNRVLLDLFKQIGIRLIDFKIEFGRRPDGTILLADEITPDTCRLWDEKTSSHLDKDVYRKNLGEIVPVYQEVLDRLKQKFN